MSYNTVTAYVKGGMPVAVSGTDAGDYIEDIRIYWASTGKPVTAKFEASLTSSDWDSILVALSE